jgi:hypothetical protein
MKTALILLSALFVSTTLLCQDIETILALTPVKQAKRSPISENREFFIQTPFSKPLIIDQSDQSQIMDATILKVELVYTAYRSEASFDQNALNKKRLLSLKAQIPKLFSDYSIEWKLVEQTGCNSPATCNELFHGFIVTTRAPYTDEDMKEELAFLDDLFGPEETAVVEKLLIMDLPVEPVPETKIIYSELNPADVKLAAVPEPDSKGFTPAYYPTGNIGLLSKLNYFVGRPSKTDPEEVYYARLTIDQKGQVQSVELRLEEGKGKSATALHQELLKGKWKPARMGSTRVVDQVEVKLIISHRGVGMEVDGMFVETPKKTGSGLHRQVLRDSTILKVFERHEDWNDMSIVGDLTGSMSPYTAQILLWHKLNVESNTSRTKHFTFFNDGDNKPNKSKKTGATGGIYHDIGDSFEDVQKLAKQCMSGGNGGDTEENNVEALISAMENCPECKEFVLIADNYATPRDMKLLDQVTKPVRVIVCGAGSNINPAYLQIAFKTGGSLHTLKSDLDELVDKSEGSKFEFEGVHYQIKAGEIVPLSRM